MRRAQGRIREGYSGRACGAGARTRRVAIGVVANRSGADAPANGIHVAHRAHLDAAGARPRELRGDPHRFVHVVGLDQAEAAVTHIGLGERPAAHAGPTATHTHGLTAVPVLHLLHAAHLHSRPHTI